MNSNRLELLSPLSPTECAARISSTASSGSSWFGSRRDPSTSEPIIGRVTGSSLWLRRRIAYNNSFQIFFRGELRAEGGGTRIIGTFAMSGFVQVFMSVWLVGVVLLGGIIFVATLASFAPGSSVHVHGDNLYMGLIIPPVMFCGGVGMLLLGRFLARNEPRIITESLARVVNGKIVIQPAVPSPFVLF